MPSTPEKRREKYLQRKIETVVPETPVVPKVVVPETPVVPKVVVPETPVVPRVCIGNGAPWCTCVNCKKYSKHHQ